MSGESNCAVSFLFLTKSVSVTVFATNPALCWTLSQARNVAIHSDLSGCESDGKRAEICQPLPSPDTSVNRYLELRND